MSGPLSDEDLTTLRTAAFGAVVLVSNTEPGFFAMLRESYAAAGALVAGDGVVRQVITAGDVPRLPDGSADELSAVVLPALTRAVRLLRAAAPTEVEVFQRVVVDATERAARAVAGVSAGEAGMLARIRSALDVT